MLAEAVSYFPVTGSRYGDDDVGDFGIGDVVPCVNGAALFI